MLSLIFGYSVLSIFICIQSPVKQNEAPRGFSGFPAIAQLVSSDDLKPARPGFTCWRFFRERGPLDRIIDVNNPVVLGRHCVKRLCWECS